jgi:hypothetical protein
MAAARLPDRAIGDARSRWVTRSTESVPAGDLLIIKAQTWLMPLKLLRDAYSASTPALVLQQSEEAKACAGPLPLNEGGQVGALELLQRLAA